MKWTLLFAALASLAACANTVDIFGAPPAEGGSGGTGGQGGSGPGPLTPTDKVDLLFAIDNSRHMTDKAEILAAAVPNLIGSFTNPPCVDGNRLPVAQPSAPSEACPSGSERLFRPITDLHVGVVTSSLGGRGADVCTSDGENDRALLITRDAAGGDVPTYEGYGFLAWDPQQQQSPPGEVDPDALAQNLSALLLGAGQRGCGYEATMESWYRFLIDPNPYETVVVEPDGARLVGTDQTLLRQRREFLRPDSLVAILMLSDENDCSVRDGGQFFVVMQVSGPSGIFHLPKARAACATDPNDPCCRSCGQAPGTGCDTSQDDCASPLSEAEDHINVRCFDQKRRFGIDFLNPVDRYVIGLTSAQISDRDGNVVANPLFSDLDPTDALTRVRDPRHVFVTSVVGVPWQDIARRNASGAPDLVLGLDGDGTPRGGLMSADELAKSGVWDLVVGDVAAYVPPTDPMMRESIQPRGAAMHPITGDPVAPPGAAYNANTINGHERTIADNGDLQYACVFPLPAPRDCGNPNVLSCECEPGNDNPLCQNPDNDQFGTTQYRAKAYPGIRQLELVRKLGDQGVAGSICPAQLTDPTGPDYGYLPTVRALNLAVAGALER